MGWYDRKVRRVRDLSCGDTRIFLELEWAAGGPRSALHQGSEIHVAVAQGEPDARRLCEHDLRLWRILPYSVFNVHIDPVPFLLSLSVLALPRSMASLLALMAIASRSRTCHSALKIALEK
jgi:hypothetical protein